MWKVARWERRDKNAFSSVYVHQNIVCEHSIPWTCIFATWYGQLFSALYTNTCIHTWYKHTNKHTSIHAYIPDTYIYTYIHACMHACMHACIHTYTCIHTSTCSYIHKFIQAICALPKPLLMSMAGTVASSGLSLLYVAGCSSENPIVPGWARTTNLSVNSRTR